MPATSAHPKDGKARGSTFVAMIRGIPMFLPFYMYLLLLLSASHRNLASAGYVQDAEQTYLSNFDAMVASSYSAVDDVNVGPPELLVACKDGGVVSQPGTLPEVVATADNGGNIVLASAVQSQCGEGSTCVIPAGLRLIMDSSLNVAALIVRGELLWRDVDQQSTQSRYLCAGYVAVEDHGRFEMNLQDGEGWIYIKDNGMVHPVLRARGFGGVVPHHNDVFQDHYPAPVVDITGREMERTWSLLSNPLLAGQTSLRLLHNPARMGWRVGDRVGIASTRSSSRGTSQTFKITSISEDGTIGLDGSATDDYAADFLPPPLLASSSADAAAALMSAEVVNLSRNIVITGDDFVHVPCDPNLPEAVPGEQTSTQGCRCSSYRNTCTIGLHTIQMHSGVTRIRNVRVEKCGQRGIEGKYCLHFHKLADCPGCAFENNAIEFSHQRGIIVHGTHLSTVSNNVMFDVRGAGIYVEDGNEMWNTIEYNVIICPWPLKDPTMQGCTVPGTSNLQADTSVNQAGIFTVTATVDLVGNRASNSFNGMLLDANGIGRGEAYGKICSNHNRFGRWEGNTFHGHGRFGTYTLGGSLPRWTDAAVSSNGYNINDATCEAFDNEGNDRGAPVAILNNVDYGNAFVGHYTAGDMQHRGHKSIENNNLIYWKETKAFPDGCGAHISDAFYSRGNLALPDHSTFIIQNSVLDGVTLEASHHCMIGTTGFLCMPQYVLHNVRFRNGHPSGKWFWSLETGGASGGGGVFTLSPPSAAKAALGDGDDLIFPPGFVSLASGYYVYLLDLPDDLCVAAASLGQSYATRYDNGILCRVPLRVLKVWSRNLLRATAPDLFVEAWADGLGIISQDTNPPTSSQFINYHSIKDVQGRQGYSLPVIPMPELISYRLSLMSGNGAIPSDWIIEFSDPVMGNRWGEEYVQITIEGRDCGPDDLVSSQHDRRYMSGVTMAEVAWGAHGACLGATQPPDMPNRDCGMSEGTIAETDCPDLCPTSCDPSNSFCHCGTGTCKCKSGFAGTDCSIDLCSAARCGENGTCAAKYLSSASSSLPVTSSEHACICNEGWTGPLCNINPCLASTRTCSGNGKCVPDGYVDTCVCDDGFYGNDCELGATASSTKVGTANTADKAIDGDSSSRWESEWSDPQWISIDLGKSYSLLSVELGWEGAFGKEYRIETSEDNVSWSTVFTESNGNGGVDVVDLRGSSGRYVRMYGTARGTMYGYSLWEFKAQFEPSSCATDADCDDGSPCTQDSCIAGTCQNTPNGNCYPISTENECEVLPPCNEGEACPEPMPRADNTPCNSVPYGICQGGICVRPATAPSTPSPRPTKQPTGRPTLDMRTPAPSPLTFSPTKNPANAPTFDGCEGFCVGSYPFGCAEYRDGKTIYRCGSDGGCHYASSPDEWSPEGYCKYKTILETTNAPTTLPQSPSPTMAPIYARVYATDHFEQSGTQTGSGGTTVGRIDGGDYLSYGPLNFGSTGTSNAIRLRYAKASGGGLVEFRVGEPPGTIIGAFLPTYTGGWNTWEEAIVAVNPEGEGVLTILAVDGTDILNLDWFELARV